MKYITQKQLLIMIKNQVESHGSGKAFAKAANVSQSYLSDILAGKRNPNPGVQKFFGLQAEVVYIDRAEDGDQDAFKINDFRL